MARRRSNQVQVGRPRRQFLVSSPRLVRPIFTIRRLPVVFRRPPLEDRRRWHPDGVFRRLETFGFRDSARVRVQARRSFRFPDVFRFADPRRVIRCVKRKERREVLHAIKKIGSGAGRPKRRNYWSNISCK